MCYNVDQPMIRTINALIDLTIENIIDICNLWWWIHRIIRIIKIELWNSECKTIEGIVE